MTTPTSPIQSIEEILNEEGYCYDHSYCNDPACLGTKANKRAVLRLLEYFESLIGEDDDEGDGWDIYFGDRSRCCPGDDIADARNQLRDQIRERIRSQYDQ